MKILVAIDGSPSAQAGIALLGRLPLPSDTRMTVLEVVHVVKPVVAERGPLIGHRVRELLKEVVAEERARVCAQVEEVRVALASSGVVVAGEVREGDPAEQIVEAARELTAHLLVMGSRGLGPLKGLLLGSVSRKVVRHAPCSVLLVKPPAEPGAEASTRASGTTGRLTVLLASDGSRASEHAAEFLRKLAFGRADALTILVVIPRFTPAQRVLPAEVEQAERASAELLLADLRERLSAQFGETTTALALGDASQRILEQVAEMTPDLLVVGSMGLSAVEAFFLGSVSEKMLRHASCPVLVVREPPAPGRES